MKWLQQHNRLYKDVILNEEVLNSMPDKYVLPVQIEHIVPSEFDDTRTSRYDVPAFGVSPASNDAVEPREVCWENVVISDVEAGVVQMLESFRC